MLDIMIKTMYECQTLFQKQNGSRSKSKKSYAPVGITANLADRMSMIAIRY